jgi:hypothetical protein
MFNRLEYIKKWQEENPEKMKAYRKTWYYDHGGKEKAREYEKNIGIEIRAKIKKKRNEHLRLRRKIDKKYKLSADVRVSVWKALKYKRNNINLSKKLGYAIEELRKHLEKQFDDKMAWGNYGSYWGIDHKKPISLFNFSDINDKEFKLCWKLTNLQPLEKLENIHKSNKF